MRTAYRRHAEERKKELEKHRQAFKQFMDVFNKWGTLFPDTVDLKAQYHAVIYQAQAYEQVPFDPNYWGFLVDVDRSFDSLTREAIHMGASGDDVMEAAEAFELEKWSRDMLISHHAGDYFRINFNRWRKQQQEAIERTPVPSAP